ncbi:MFS transporter [Tsukamurella strandjordii]
MMRGQVLVAACLAQLSITLDVSVVNVALPTVRDELGLTAVGQQWVVTAYLLPYAGLLLVGGRLSDVLGVRAAFLAGSGAFAAASLVAGAAPSAEILLAGRALQGSAAAVLAPAALATITSVFVDDAERTTAMAWWSATSVAGGTAGNVCGGLLTELAGWRATLLVNVPLGIVAFLLASRALPTRTARSRPRLDGAPAALATGGLLATAYAVSAAGQRDLVAAGVAAGVGAMLLGAFLLCDRRSAHPLLPRSVLAARQFRWGNAGVLLSGAALVPMWLFLSLQMQGVLGYTALQAGMGFVPHTLIQLAVGLRATPVLMRHLPPPVLIAVGATSVAFGFLLQSRLAPGDTYLGAVFVPAVFIAAGAGLFTLPLTKLAVAGAPAGTEGVASGIMNCAKQVGGGLGLSALVAATTSILDDAASYRVAFILMSVIAGVVAFGALVAHRGSRAADRG